MEIDKLLVLVFSLGGIIFTYWLFLMKKNEDVIVVKSNKVDILVKGGYNPSAISIPKNKVTTLRFLRRDQSSCLEEVVLPEFKIRKYLPLNKVVAIQIEPKKSGNYEISCGMNMFHGKMIVR